MAAIPAGLRLLRRLVPPVRQKKIKEADYVVVGAGSAGCVLANELSADGSHSVVVIEAGPWDSNPLIHIPAGVYSVFKDPSINWNYESEPEAGCNGRRIELPRGKVVGGSSSINAMVYTRGHPLDYDGWAAQHGLGEWRFDDCLPYFKACERSDRGESDYRGGGGRLAVTRGATANPLFDAFLAAGAAAGQGASDDLNGYRPEGVSRLDRTTAPSGARASAATAHLLPALERENVALRTGATVDRVLFEGESTRAVGVALADGTVIKATKEVVLCAGSIKTPQLLMLSGVGAKGHLESRGVDCRVDLPGVGGNLMDHACINVAFGCDSGDALDRFGSPLHKAAAGAQWLLDGSGPAASNVWEAGGLVKSDADQDYPNLQYHMAPVYAEYRGKDDLALIPGFQVQVDQLRPFSRGRVALASKDPNAPPAATFNYLTDDRDVRELVDGYKRAMDLLTAAPLDAFRADLKLPPARLGSDAEIEAFVRSTSGTDYHPCGTAKMGHGPDAVVDAQCRVRGCDNLRVVDASVFPDIPSGNLNAPTQMVALRAADFILGRPQKRPERPPFHFDDALAAPAMAA